MSSASASASASILVHIAENGHSFEFHCDGATAVRMLQDSMRSLSGIPVGDQLLFSGNTLLDSCRTLAFYKLPCRNCEVFLFKKSSLVANAPCPGTETIQIPEANLPPPPPTSGSSSPHPLDDSCDPALKALASYEHLFRYNFRFAKAIYDCAQAKLETCKRLVREQQVQERALETVRASLKQTFCTLQLRYKEFRQCYSQQNQRHLEILARFDRDMDKLRSVKLHPALQTESRKSLMDFVEEGKLHKVQSRCMKLNGSFDSKFLVLKAEFQELETKVESVLGGMPFNGSKKLVPLIKEHEEMLNQQSGTMQNLSEDIKEVKNLVDKYLKSQLSATPCSHNAISSLGPKYNDHQSNLLPNIQNCGSVISKLTHKCMSKKNGMTSFVHESMQRVQSVQSDMKFMISKLHLFQDAIGQQEKEFKDLKLVNGLFQAYRACLCEIVRRKSSLKLYMGRAGQLVERIAMERDLEIRKRQEFCKSWSNYIPRGIFASMGLIDFPSQLDVSIAPFDTNLLEIDIADVKQLAPEFEADSLSKLDLLSQTADFHGDCESLNITGTDKVEVENVWLKAKLASAIAQICFYDAECRHNSADGVKQDDALVQMKEKMIEALHLKDEYGKQLQTMLQMKQAQCLSYEKRIQELEQRLSDKYMQEKNFSTFKYAYDHAYEADVSMIDICKRKIPQLSGEGANHIPDTSTELKNESFSASALVESKIDQNIGNSAEPMDSSHNSLDSSISEPPREDYQSGDVGVVEKMEPRDAEMIEEIMTTQLNVAKTDRFYNEISLNMLRCEIAAERLSESKLQ